MDGHGPGHRGLQVDGGSQILCKLLRDRNKVSEARLGVDQRVHRPEPLPVGPVSAEEGTDEAADRGRWAQGEGEGLLLCHRPGDV